MTRVPFARLTALVGFALLALPGAGWHGAESDHRLGGSASFDSITVYPQATHATAAAHLESAAGVERPACTACILSVQTASRLATVAHGHEAPAPSRFSFEASEWTPRGVRLGPGGGRAPPLA